MSLPPPRVGQVIRYSFLWSHEAREGATEGRKDRPVAVVVASRKLEDCAIQVIVAPVTHEPPVESGASIEIPADAVKALGLDDKRQWLMLDELNRFTWPGFDIRQVPGRAGVYSHGSLSEDLYARLKSGILARQKTKAVKTIARDE